MKTSVLLIFLTILYSACTRHHQTGDLRIIKERIVALNTGNGIPSSGEYKKAAIRELEASAQLILEQGSHIPTLDISRPGVESKVSATYGRILVLAKAYNTPGQKYYHSGNLLVEINNSLQHSLEWSKPGSQFPGNWYYWQIDAPKSLGPALVMMQDFLDEGMMKDQIAGLQNLITDLPYLTGANGVMQGGGRINYAVLTNDENKMRDAMHLINIELAVTNVKTGILEDYSYQFHDMLLYTGGYGAHFALNASIAIYLTKDTKFEPSEDRVNIFNKYLIEHTQWTIINNFYDISVKGRELRSSPRVSLTPFLLMSQYPSEFQEKMKVITSRLLSFNRGSLSLNDAPFADKFENPANTPLNGFRYFYKADYGVARRPEFFVSVKMFSDRTMDYEYLTGMNINGRNLSSGMTYFSRTGNELWSHTNNLEAVYDWEHLPGTTARLGVRPSNFSNFSESKFAGGAGSQDNGIISFQLIPVVNDFHARKSYFMFPSGLVALGSDITSNKKAEPVSTTVTQWGLSNPNQPLILSNGNIISTTASAELKSLDWAYCDSAGYIFQNCSNISMKKDSLYTTIFLNHGSNPQKDKYAYTILPACSQQQVIDYSASPEVHILENSEKIHALRDVKINATGIIFWEPGTFDLITVNHPAIVYYEEKNGSIALSVCNPIYNQDTIQLTLDKKFDNFDLPSEASISNTAQNTVITLKTANRRMYRIGLGGIKVEQPPREDNMPYETFKILKVENTRTSTYLTVYIPEIARNHYRLFVHYWISRLETELLPANITDTISPGVYRYKWDNAGTLTKKHFNGNHTHTIRLTSGIHNVWDFFTVERDSIP